MLVLLTMSANALIVGFIYRYHHAELAKSNIVYRAELAKIVSQTNELKQEIQFLEGAPTWEETQYAKAELE